MNNTFDLTNYGFLANPDTKLPKEFGYLLNDTIPQQTPINMQNYSNDEVKKIYSVLSMKSHKFLFNDETNIPQILPWYYGQPWHESAQILGLPTVLTHASVDLYN